MSFILKISYNIVLILESYLEKIKFMPWERNDIGMNTLLLFFALPVATIILAIVLQKVLNSPILVALTFFAIFLVVTFAAFDESFLVFSIIYTIIAYSTAVITRFLKRFISCANNSCQNSNCANNEESEENNSNNDCGCRNETSRENNSLKSYNRRYWR